MSAFPAVFQRLTGLTPHQYVRRARLRRAATRLMLDQARVLDIALDSGFGDISNFNHAFREEFAISPVAFRTCATSSTNSPPHGPSAANATALRSRRRSILNHLARRQRIVDDIIGESQGLVLGRKRRPARDGQFRNPVNHRPSEQR